MSEPVTSGASPEDVAEQQATPARDAADPAVTELPDDATDADALEQATPVAPGEHAVARELPLEADAADAAEQAVVVDGDDDERR